jgi:23S rRNA (adenine2503-C2)-methyltransferase
VPPARPPILPSPLGLTREAYTDACVRAGAGSGRATAAYERFYREGVTEGLEPGVAPIVRRLEEPCDEGTTVKFCQRLDAPGEGRFARQGVPHLDIESVVIPMIGRTKAKTHTLCVSSQVGCAMGCGFCETAQMGLVRSLSAAEIVGQWWAARHVEHADIDNIVFMGMGEPLDNLDEVLAAVACLTDHRGASVPMSKITISTVGRVDGMRRLAQAVQRPGWKRLGIALSVNAPNDAVRDAIMPVNKRWDMAELRNAMLELNAARGGRKVLFEYVLIPGVNDAPEHAGQLADWLAPFTRDEHRGHIGLLNVIPYNPRRDSPWPAPEEEDVRRFVEQVAARGVFVKRRRTKGRSQMAACGQLGTAEIRGRRYVPVTISPGGA